MCCVCGLAYASLTLTANTLIAFGKRAPPEEAIDYFRTAAALAPFHQTFRILPAIWAVYAESKGVVSSDDALTEVNKALDFNPNSKYILAHHARLGHER